MSKALFILGALITAFGVFKNLVQDAAIAGTGTMAMITYYILGMAVFVAAVAAELIWGRATPR